MTQQTSDMIDVGIRIAREFGFPVVMLVVVMFCAREAAIAVHQTVLVPVVESHTAFLRQTTETLQTLGRSQERQAETLEELATAQRQIRESMSGDSGTR
jgi:TPP-dependent indolepyruvate ferredoxin oxidoreductase alpha subunit